MSEYENLRKKLSEYGQSHLLHFWHELSTEEQNKLAEEICDINLKEITNYFKIATQSLENNAGKLDDRMKPVPSDQYESVQRSSVEQLNAYEREGFLRIADGQVGVLLMAGGQGTRLGVTYPKGMYDVGLPSGKSLYQIQAERILRLQTQAKERVGKTGTIAWYIMTSEHTKEGTQTFFKKNDYFGLNKEDVIMFEQFMLPCFDFDGKIMLDSKSRIALAPDGNGGIYRALKERGILDDMERRGIKYVHAHSVDNILVKVADPIFIGYCVLKEAECGAKVVEKTLPNEPVGVVCKVDGRYQVVEYSEISEDTAELRSEDGSLVFNAGNICNHFFTVDFLNKIAVECENSLKLHVAKKKIPCIDDKGFRICPEKPNGIKIEKFVFDVFEFADRFVTWEIQREVEFSAMKNSDSAKKDCPCTAREDLFRLHKKYITDAGGSVLGNECEISPLLSYSGENLCSLVNGKMFTAPVLLKSSEEE